MNKQRRKELEKATWLIDDAKEIVWAIAFITLLLSLDSVTYGFFNPEYWALKKIMEFIK